MTKLFWIDKLAWIPRYRTSEVMSVAVILSKVLGFNS